MSELLDAAGRRRSPATLPEFPHRAAAAQQGDRLPRRPSHGQRDRRRHATRRQRCLRGAAAGAHRRALARRAADLRGARARRGRPRSAPRFAAGAVRQGRPTPRGRHGRLGVGAARTMAPGAGRAAGRTAVLHRQGSDTRTAVDSRCRPLGTAPRTPARPGCVGALRRTSCATRMSSRWPATACR
jgi:hypothetical protein